MNYPNYIDYEYSSGLIEKFMRKTNTKKQKQNSTNCPISLFWKQYNKQNRDFNGSLPTQGYKPQNLI